MDPQASLVEQDRVDLAVRTAAANRLPVSCYLARLAPGSRRTMAQALRWIAEEFSQGRSNVDCFPWEQLRYEHTQAIRAKLAMRYSPATANKMLSALRGVLKECWRLGKLNVEDMHKAADLQPIRGSRIVKGRCLTKEEVENLCLHAIGFRDRVLIEFMVTTGLRRFEVAALEWADFSPAPTVRVRGKGNKERDVPVPVWVARKMVGLVPAGTQRGGPIFKVSASRIWHILRDVAWSGGMATVTPHDLRRTYATRLLGAGVDLPTVQRLMGHSNPRTTANYDRRGIEDARHAVEQVFSS